MSVYRSQVKIVADVLSSINDGSEGQSGLGITRIIQKANLSYGRATKIVTRLVDSGLVEQITVDNNQRYVLSHKGIEYLRSHSDFADFAESFGMKL
ncbi:MAG: winged helix-turn-helix domain-containing protein [Nitrososphaerales archaeon]|tara:strand:- start:89 stop:376 length:288 start_codon:yes stop_codon:yes gene_type:complete